MPIGTCDPASRGDAYNSGELAIDNGNVTIEYRYGWDGTSTRETGCVGPFVQGTGAGNRWALRAVNNSQITYWAHFTGKRGTPRTIQMDPGFNQTYTVTQLNNNGFLDNTDLDELSITTTP